MVDGCLRSTSPKVAWPAPRRSRARTGRAPPRLWTSAAAQFRALSPKTSHAVYASPFKATKEPFDTWSFGTSSSSTFCAQSSASAGQRSLTLVRAPPDATASVAAVVGVVASSAAKTRAALRGGRSGAWPHLLRLPGGAQRCQDFRAQVCTSWVVLASIATMSETVRTCVSRYKPAGSPQCCLKPAALTCSAYGRGSRSILCSQETTHDA